MRGHPVAERLVADKLAAIMRPPVAVTLSQWLAANLVLVDGPFAGELWSTENAPYLAEIADCLSDDDPCNVVSVRKSQQSGASILALGWCLYVADREPANMLYAIPGIDALRELNSAKLQPLIEAWQKRARKSVIVPQTSRSGVGSTTYEKVFTGGRLFLGNANAVMDLSSKTIKKGVKDEFSKWEDIPGYGDPDRLFLGRFTAFRRTKDFKILEISTPEIDAGDESGEAEGHCRIDRSFRRSDQRFWHCECPECHSMFVHQFDRLRIDAARPHRTTYECECGHLVSEAERVVAVRAGEWLAKNAAGSHPGFHIDAFISLMMSYEAIAEDANAAKTETEKKAFTNLVLGLPYKYVGNAPDHKVLMGRREEGLTRGHIAPRGLVLTAFADVQMRGIWFEVVAHAPNRESWTVEADYLDGDTSNYMGEVFEQLRKRVLDHEFPDAFGRTRRIDALGVDSGYRSHVVYAWVRNNQRIHPDTGRDLVLATKGDKGWSKPAIGQPVLIDIDLEGKKVKQGCKLWALGTWPIKGSFYSDLHQEGMRSGAPRDPDGYCHFGMWCDERYFRQLTAERLEDIKFKGRITGRQWVKAAPDNHFLDCRVGNIALFEYLGASSTTADQWIALARLRGLPEAIVQDDLFAPRPVAVPAAPGAAASAGAPAPAAPAGPAAIDRQAARWIDARPDWLRRD